MAATQGSRRNAGIGGPGRRGANRPVWTTWKGPVAFAGAFCLLEVAVFAVRFGLDWQIAALVPAITLGLAEMFAAGLISGWFLLVVLRRAGGRWRIALAVAAAVATPFSLLGSMIGGLLGPIGVVVYTTAPYLILVGLPVLAKSTWQRMTGGPDRRGSCC